MSRLPLPLCLLARVVTDRRQRCADVLTLRTGLTRRSRTSQISGKSTVEALSGTWQAVGTSHGQGGRYGCVVANGDTRPSAAQATATADRHSCLLLSFRRATSLCRRVPGCSGSKSRSPPAALCTR
eukprot:scaffold1458_cov377-Prasinococcus_capsulatus_cf.AAC.1